MPTDVRLGTPLVSTDEIERRVREIAGELNRDFRNDDRVLSVIIVLKGACFFAIDLLKHLQLPVRVDFLQASSYSGMGSTGEVTLHKDISMPIAGTPVLLVEDIVDTGLTASWLLRHLSGHGPERVRLCTLLDKPSRRRIPVPIDYVGFQIPDAFVLGYGLDYEERFRNLPAIYVAQPADDESSG